MRGFINKLSESHSYDPNSSGLENFWQQFFVKGLSGVLVGGAADETYSRIAAAKEKCAPDIKTPLEFEECKEEITKIGGYFTAPFVFVDSIIQIILDHPDMLSRENSEKYSKYYNSGKSLLGNFIFYLLTAMALAVLIGKRNVSDETFGIGEVLPAIFMAIFSDPHLREKMRISQCRSCGNGLPYVANQDPRDKAAVFFDVLFGICTGGAIGRGFIEIIEKLTEQLNIATNVGDSLPGKGVRWAFAALHAVIQGSASYLRSPSAPPNYQLPPGSNQQKIYKVLSEIQNGVKSSLSITFTISLISRMITILSPAKEIQLALTLTAIIINLIRALLVSFNSQPHALAAPLLGGGNPPDDGDDRRQTKSVSFSPPKSSKKISGDDAYHTLPGDHESPKAAIANKSAISTEHVVNIKHNTTLHRRHKGVANIPLTVFFQDKHSSNSNNFSKARYAVTSLTKLKVG